MEKNTKLHTIQPFATKVFAILFENMHLSHVQALILDNIAKTISIRALQNLTEQFEKSLLDKISLSLQNNTEFRQKILKKFRLRILIDHYHLQHSSVNYLDKDILNLLVNDYLKENEQVIIEKYLNPWRSNKLEDSEKVQFEKVLIKCLEPISQGLSKFIKNSIENKAHGLYHELTTQAEKYQINLLIETAQILITYHSEDLIAAIPQLKDYFAAVEAQLSTNLSSSSSVSQNDSFDVMQPLSTMGVSVGSSDGLKNSCEYLTAVIDETANDHLNNIAVEEWNPSAKEYKSYTYQELKERSDALAAWLISQHFPADAIVGLFLEPSFDYVCCQLAVLKANLAFVPLDPYQDVGLERLKGIVATCAPVVILTHTVLQGHAFATHCKDSQFIHKTYDVEALLNSKKLLLLNNNLNNIESTWKKDKTNNKQRAYVIFTSGSTGNPKGIEISHAGIMPMVRGLASAMDIQPKDCMAQYAQLGFDMSLAEIWVPLCYGAKLKIIPLAKRLDYAELPTHFEGVTIAMLTPTVLRHFEAKLNKPVFKQLRYVISAGEKGDLKLFANWMEKRPGLIIRNGYGPAECSVATTMCALDDKHSDTLHIGEPLPGYTLYLLSLDNDEQPHVAINSNHLKQFCEAQLGTLYELAIGGVGVGIGYYNNPDLTQKRFLTLKHPLTGELIKIFRTYDAVKLIPTTSKSLLTVEKRLDRAIKPYGKIIYPEDIEDELKEADPNIQEVRVEAKLTEKGHPEIAAYLKFRNETQSVNYVELFEYVKQHLSLTHAPRGWKIVKSFEVSTSNKAKVSSQSLDYIREIDHYYPIADQKIELLWANLQALWQQILELPRFEFNLNDAFFRLGGTSIRCQELVTGLMKEFKVKLTAEEIYRNPTFGHMLRLIRKQQNSINIELIKFDNKNVTPNCEPLFLIHTLTGDATADYQPLISSLKSDMKKKGIKRFIYGLSAPSITHHPIDMPPTIEEIAALYCEVIQNQQPEGPYYLLGWSAGGSIAYEIACQLRNQGERVTVFMLDTVHPCYRQNMNNNEFSEHLEQTAESFFIPLLMTKGIQINLSNYKIDRLLDKHQQINTLFNELHNRVQQKDKAFDHRSLCTYAHMLHALLDYRVKEVLPFIHLYIAEKSNKERLPELGWQQQFYQAVTLKGADHKSIINNAEHRKQLTHVLAEHMLHIQSHLFLKPIIDDLKTAYRQKILSLKKVIVPVNLEAIKVSENINKNQYLNNELLNLYQCNNKVKNILITGEKGSGKTYLKHALLDQWAKQTDSPSFALIIPISLRKFKNKKLKNIADHDKLTHVIKTVLRTQTSFHNTIFDASEFMAHLNFLAPHILIIIDNYEKILHSESYTDIKNLIDKLITKKNFNILLLADTYNAPLKAFNKNSRALHLSIAAWEQTKIQQFIQTNYSDDKFVQYKNFCKLHPEISVLCRNPAVLKLLLKNFKVLDIEDKNLSFNFVKTLQVFEKYQWRKYLENSLSAKNIDEWDLHALRVECEKEFKFLSKFAFDSFEDEKIEYEHNELINSSKSLEDSLHSSGSEIDIEKNKLLKNVLQTSFIYQKNAKEKIYKFKSELIRDYFYALYWAKHPTKKLSKAIWNSNRWNPKFRQIWSLAAGILAIEAEKENKSSLNNFFNELVYKNEQYKPIGFYQYLVWMDCYREARDQITDDNVKQIIVSKVVNLMQWHLERLSQNMYYEEFDYSFISALKTNSYLLHEPNVEIFLISALKNNNGRIPPFLWILELLQLSTTLSPQLEEVLLNILKQPAQHPFLQSALQLYLKNEQEHPNNPKCLSYLKVDNTLANNILLKQVYRPLLNLLKTTEQGSQYIVQVAALDKDNESFSTNINTLLPWLIVDDANGANNNTNQFVIDDKILEWVKACVEIAQTVLETEVPSKINLVCSYYQAVYALNIRANKLKNLNYEEYEQQFNQLKIADIKQLPVDKQNYRKFLFSVIEKSNEYISNGIFTPFNKAKTLIIEYVVEIKRNGVEILLDAISKIYMDDPNQKDKFKQNRLVFYLDMLKDNLELEFLSTTKLNTFIKDKLVKHKKHSKEIEVLKFAQYISMLSTVDFKDHLKTLELSPDLTEQDVKRLFKSTICSLKALYDYWNAKQYNVQTLIPLFVSWIMQRNIMLWFSKNGIVITEPGNTTSHELLELNDTNKEFYDLLQMSCDNCLAHQQFSSNLEIGQDKKLLKQEKKIMEQEQKLLEEKTNTTLEIINRVLKKADKQLEDTRHMLEEDKKHENIEKKKSKLINNQLSLSLFKSNTSQIQDNKDHDYNQTLTTTLTMPRI